MNIPVILNGNKIILEAQADEPLMSVLQKKGCSSVKCGCNEGSCGSCTVLLEDKPIPSCKVPVGIVRDEKIITLESYQIFKQNKNFTRAEITEQVRHLAPCCTDLETLVNGIVYAISLKEAKTTRTRMVRSTRKR